MPKTGTSSIQKTLYDDANAAVLEKNGFRYLTEWGWNHVAILRFIFSPNPPPLGNRNYGKPISKRRHKKDVNFLSKKLLKVMNTTECKTLILSGECSEVFLQDSAIENLKDYIRQYFQSNDIDVKIILLIRNPLSWFISSLQQKQFGGRYLRSDDFFESRIKQYEGIIKLKNYFPDSIALLNFDEFCLDKDGLVGGVLKAIGFPEGELANIAFFRSNDSRSMEVMEFVNYIESVQPLLPHSNFKFMNPNRTIIDLTCIKGIKGEKFDLPHQSKIELWERMRETVENLKKNTGIDFTDYKVPISTAKETWNEQTVQEFINAFPKLSIVIQKLFLKFFEMKYAQTAQVKFKQLYFKGSIPWKTYNNKHVFLMLLIYPIKNTLPKIVPQAIKLFLQRRGRKRGVWRRLKG